MKNYSHIPNRYCGYSLFVALAKLTIQSYIIKNNKIEFLLKYCLNVHARLTKNIANALRCSIFISPLHIANPSALC